MNDNPKVNAELKEEIIPICVEDQIFSKKILTDGLDRSPAMPELCLSII